MFTTESLMAGWFTNFITHSQPVGKYQEGLMRIMQHTISIFTIMEISTNEKQMQIHRNKSKKAGLQSQTLHNDRKLLNIS